jgi:hypothetical protein
VLTAATFAIITFPGDSLTGQIQQFATDLATSDYWQTVVGEYGVGPATVVNVAVADPPPLTTDDAQIQSYLIQHLLTPAPGWPPLAENTVYILFYPDQTTITDPPLCVGALGYHSAAFAGRGKPFAYAVIPRCPDFGESALDFVTQVTSHELAEAATDPSPFAMPAYSHASDFAWQTAAGGGEVGDMCQSKPGAVRRDPDLGYVLQRIWSNAEAAAGHDPCLPHPSGDVYFQAAPDATDMITLHFSNGTADTPTSGLQIPLHATRDVDVHLFSDGATAPITVWAQEWPISPTPDTPDLALSWDRTTGRNGDTLHLTVAVDSDHAGEGHEYFTILAQVGDLVQRWPVVVANN